MPKRKNGYNQRTGLIDVLLYLPVKPCWKDRDCFVVYIDGMPQHILKGNNCEFVNGILKERDKKLKAKYRLLAQIADEKQTQLKER